MSANQELKVLEAYLLRIPGMEAIIGRGHFEDGNWWIKFNLDINHRLAWNAVQELGSLLNSVALNAPLPTTFMPVSPPPYLNGGPEDFLSWVIESKSVEFTPALCAEWLEGRLPRPVEDIEQWTQNE